MFRNVSRPEQDLLLLNITPRHCDFADMLIDNDADAYGLLELLQTRVELNALFTLRGKKLTEKQITFEQFSATWQQSPLAALRQLFLYPLSEHDMPILLKSMAQTDTTTKDIYLRHMQRPELAPFRIIHITTEAICF